MTDYKSMFEQAVRTLAAIDEALGIGDDGCDDPVYSCDLYRDKEAGSCAHVDGPLCDFPKCSMLSDYRREKEGMTIKDDPQFREDLRKMMAEQRGKSGPVPHRVQAACAGLGEAERLKNDGDQ